MRCFLCELCQRCMDGDSVEFVHDVILYEYRAQRFKCLSISSLGLSVSRTQSTC